MITPDTPQQMIDYSIKLAKDENLDCGYFYYTTKPTHTYSGNRSFIETQIYHAIIKGNKLLNKVLIESFQTNLRLNYGDTKSTPETHQKKLENKIKNYNGIRNAEDILKGITTVMKGDYEN